MFSIKAHFPFAFKNHTFDLRNRSVKNFHKNNGGRIKLFPIAPFVSQSKPSLAISLQETWPYKWRLRQNCCLLCLHIFQTFPVTCHRFKVPGCSRKSITCSIRVGSNRDYLGCNSRCDKLMVIVFAVPVVTYYALQSNYVMDRLDWANIICCSAMSLCHVR